MKSNCKSYAQQSEMDQLFRKLDAERKPQQQEGRPDDRSNHDHAVHQVAEDRRRG
jgi:hypothetical protein